MACDDGASFFRYLASSEEDEKWGIVCTDAGRNEIGPGTPYPPHKEGHPNSFKSVAVGRILNEYQVIYITRGSGSFESFGLALPVVPGSIILLFPGIRHLYKPDIEIGWTEYWVGFRGEMADRLVERGFISPERPLYEIGQRADLVAAFTRILDLVRSQEPLYQIRASSAALSLVAEVLAFDRIASQPTQAERLVQRAKLLMEERIYGEINLAAICDALGVSASRLNEVFKAYTSMTPYQYFISIKMQKAKELLGRGECQIKEVAFRLGFRDEYYFSRLFKSKVGVSPSQWCRSSGGL
jgi:AraC-type DNA-binding domain-containing proteins